MFIIFANKQSTMVHKILVIRFRRIGDSVLATALCRSLKESFPQAEIHFIINENISPLYLNHPDIDKVITFSDKENHGFNYIKKVWNIVHETDYDVIIDMRSTIKTLPFSLFSLHTKYRIGRYKKYNALLHNYRIKDLPEDDRVENNLRLMSPLSKEGELKLNTNFRLYVTNEEKAKYRRYMEAQGIDFKKPVILCAVTARLAYKVWPYDRMTRILKNIIHEFDAQLVFNYAGDAETKAAQDIWEKLGKDPHIFLNIQANGLRELCALTCNSTFFFGNEGGPRHIAQAFEIPSFAIYPPNISKQFWLPGNDPRFKGISPDDYMPEEQQKGMEYATRFDLIPESDVWTQLNEMLKQYLHTAT